MATINSLPHELIRDTLGLAYPPGEEGSLAGLSLTALVQHSWVEPSQLLLTEVLKFTSDKPNSTKLFIEASPAGYACQSLSLLGCTEADVRAVLGKARPGGIRHLSFNLELRLAPTSLFNFSSLKWLSSLELSYATGTWPSGDLVPEHHFDRWPTQLRHLSITTQVVPAELLDLSHETLTSLHVSGPLDLRESDLALLARPFPRLAAFKLTKAGPSSADVRAVKLAHLVSLFPALSDLTLAELWPQQLEALLSALALAPGRRLNRLAMGLRYPDHFGTLLAPDEALLEYEQCLMRCTELLAARGLKVWRMSMVERSAVAGSWPGFEEFEAGVAAAGITLVLGPLDD